MRGGEERVADFTTLKLQANTGTAPAGEGSGTATWTDVLFGTAGYELRAALASGSQTTSTASASWPSILKPASGTTLIDKMYAFSADATGLAITTYDGTTAHYLQFRINGDNTGTYNTAPILSAWKDNTLPAASPGTQNATTVGGDGSSIINGTSGESGSFSLLKANAYGQGLTSGGSQQTPSSNAGGTETVNGHSASGAATPGSAAWLATWQDLQAATNWIANGGIPQAVTANLWYFCLILRIAAGMTGGTLLPVLGYQYTWI
jgi:hypothetical protein